MTGPVRYGQLIDEATGYLGLAAASLTTDRLPDRAAARHAIDAYRDVLHALERHTALLLGPQVRLEAVRVSEHPDPALWTGMQLQEALKGVARRSPDQTRPTTQLAAGWFMAADALRTATDLLATHRGPMGQWRSPDAHLLDDPAARSAALARVAALAIPVAQSATHLGLRAVQTGMRSSAVARAVPVTSAVLHAALELRDVADIGRTQVLDRLGVSRPPVRSGGDPLREIGDRVARLHRTSWQLTREPHVGIGTLADIAAAAALVHAHTVALLRSTDTTTNGVGQRLLGLDVAGRAWKELHLTTRQLRTVTPASAGVRHDAVVLSQLLREAVVAAQADPASIPTTLGHLLRATDVLPQVAQWNSHVTDQLAAGGRLLMPARLLTGADVTDHPHLAALKLDRRPAPVPARVSDLISCLYEAAGPRSWPQASTVDRLHIAERRPAVSR